MKLRPGDICRIIQPDAMELMGGDLCLVIRPTSFEDDLMVYGYCDWWVLCDGRESAWRSSDLELVNEAG